MRSEESCSLLLLLHLNWPFLSARSRSFSSCSTAFLPPRRCHQLSSVQLSSAQFSFSSVFSSFNSSFSSFFFLYLSFQPPLKTSLLLWVTKKQLQQRRLSSRLWLPRSTSIFNIIITPITTEDRDFQQQQQQRSRDPGSSS